MLRKTSVFLARLVSLEKKKGKLRFELNHTLSYTPLSLSSEIEK